MSIPHLSPRTRKLVLTVHVVTSVGWLGSAYAMLVLVIAALRTDDYQLRRGAYLVMHLFDSTIAWPVGLAALLSGVLLSLTTKWGLVRYYWVAAKIVLTLVVFVAPLFARAAVIDEALVATTEPGSTAGGAASELMIPGIMALTVLTAATVLSIYKPWGKTPHGRRVAARQASAAREAAAARKTTTVPSRATASR